jgi:hypothetical protein
MWRRPCNLMSDSPEPSGGRAWPNSRPSTPRQVMDRYRGAQDQSRAACAGEASGKEQSPDSVCPARRTVGPLAIELLAEPVKR